MKISEEFKNQFDVLAKKLQISYKNINLYYEAFIHPSYANEKKLNVDYESLEFLGDAILDFLVGEYLYKTYNYNEGNMTKIRAEYVCEQANSEYAVEMGLNELILVGNGARKANEHKRDSVLGNVFESFLGALYLDHDMDYVREILKIWVFPKIKELKNEFFMDYKTKLQEYMQAERGENPTYVIVKESGPPHDKTFEAVVMADNVKLGSGIGKKRKDAEQAAAKEALDKLAK